MNENDDRSSRYPTEAHGALPAFHTTEEEAAFWDSHDFTEFWQDAEPVILKRTYNRPVQVRLDEQADHDLEVFAAEAHIKKSTLARQWLMERIQQEKTQRRAS